MKNINNQTKIILIIAGLIIILAGGYIYKNLGPGDLNNDLNEENATTTPDVVAVLTDEEGNIIEGATIEPVLVPSVPLPDYKKAIVFSGGETQEFKDIMTERINKNIADLDENSGSFDAWLDLGINRKMINDFDGAIEIWEYIGAIRPNNIVTFNNLGNIYHYELKDYVKAEENFLQAIKNDTSYIPSYINLYDLYRFSYKTDTDSATKILEEGLKNNPDNQELQQLLNK